MSAPRLYNVPSLPCDWIGEDEAGALWMWPARSNGWAERRRYLGHAPTAERRVRNYNATGTGWPWAR